MRRKRKSGLMALLLVLAMTVGQLSGLIAQAVEVQQTQSQIVLTLGADLSEEQKTCVLTYFGISESEVSVVTVTHDDEQAQLGNLISAEEIGTRTLSCALVRLTSSGGIQVKTANMNYVTSNMIASTLSTSGVYNCEVLTAAPFEVSGTGALTGVMMAYESASGQQLDEDKKELANEELVITGDISETVGQDQATLVVNDIKIHIVRDSVTDQASVNAVVDEVITTTGEAAAIAAESQGLAAPATLGEAEHQQLYEFGYKFSQMGYNYSDMQYTLERVTRNVTKSTGIDDPITDTFTTEEDVALDPDSILLNTEDEVLGDDAIINATNSVALGEHEAEPIEVFTGEVTLEEAGSVKADSFIDETNVVAYQDVGGSYALMDLNGNVLTEAIYTAYFRGDYGWIKAELDDDSWYEGVLGENGTTGVPFRYDDVDIFSEKWAAGIVVTEGGTSEDYDYVGSDTYYVIDHVDFYYLSQDGGSLVGTLTRTQYDGYPETLGEYINIRDRSGAVTTYDNTFTALRTAEYLSDFGEYESDGDLTEMLSDSTGYSVWSLYGNYARFYNYDTGKYGVMDRYGNIIIPALLDNVDSNYYGDSYEANGYFAGSMNGNFVYLTAGGTVTGSFSYSYDDVYNYGMSAYYKADDGSYILLSGDGKETNLRTTYEYLNPIRESEGMFWIGEGTSGYDLLDWHGNVLISGSDSYSLSANGNYLIAENGYTSSTLYLVNGASMVALAESAGGAAEVQAAEITEAGSLEAYTGDPQVTLVGNIAGTSFIDYTDLVAISADGVNYALMNMSGQQLTEAKYDSLEAEKGTEWIIARLTGRELGGYGVLSQTGAEVIPFQYDYIEVLDDDWICAYVFNSNGTEEDYDFERWGSITYYYQIEQAVIFHISDTELTSITLTRDQIADVEACEGYLNIQDRTGAVVTCDASFTAVASASSVYNFSDYSSMQVLARQIQDSTGLDVDDSDFPNGYSRASYYNSEAGTSYYGVVDTSGNLVLPTVYDWIKANYCDLGEGIWANGYFAVEKDGLAGYVTSGGQVTCELKYNTDNFYNYGMAAEYEAEDGTFTIVAADGTETAGLEYSCAVGGYGKFWKVSQDGVNRLLDWHGNVLFENFSSVDVSYNDQYIIVQQNYGGMPQLYAVDGAVVEGVAGGETAVADGTQQETTDPAQTDAAAQTEAAAETVAADPAAQTDAAAVDPNVAQTESATVDNSVAISLLNGARSLVDTDMTTNADSILLLLQQAKALLDTANPNAATVVGSAITLMQSGAADANSVGTLITTAVGML